MSKSGDGQFLAIRAPPAAPSKYFILLNVQTFASRYQTKKRGR